MSYYSTEVMPLSESNCECGQLNAAQCTRKHGVTPSIVHHIATNNFTISRFYLDCFDSYRLCYWNKCYLLGKVSEGLLTYNGTDYLVIFHGTTRGKVLAASEQTQVALSFRVAKADFGVVPYVLVSLSAPAKVVGPR